MLSFDWTFNVCNNYIFLCLFFLFVIRLFRNYNSNGHLMPGFCYDLGYLVLCLYFVSASSNKVTRFLKLLLLPLLLLIIMFLFFDFLLIFLMFLYCFLFMPSRLLSSSRFHSPPICQSLQIYPYPFLPAPIRRSTFNLL